MKALYVTREEAEREIKATGKSYSVSSADESSIERTYCDICWSGEVQCFRTDDNEDVCAWWYDVTEEGINGSAYSYCLASDWKYID